MPIGAVELLTSGTWQSAFVHSPFTKSTIWQPRVSSTDWGGGRASDQTTTLTRCQQTIKLMSVGPTSATIKRMPNTFVCS